MRESTRNWAAPRSIAYSGWTERRTGKTPIPILTPREGDRGYSNARVRQTLTKRGVRAVIPRRSDQRPFGRTHRLDFALYRERNRGERLVGRLEQSRRIATRYEKRAALFLAMLTLAALLLWL